MATGELTASDGDQRPFQFTLRQLMATMFAACALSASYFWFGSELPAVMLELLCPASFILFAYLSWKGQFREALLLLAVAFILFIIFLPFANFAREGPPDGQCKNNLRNVALALLQYHSVYGSFPPAYVADAEGTPMHSWRVLLLPFIEQQPLYELYRFDEPWDGPNNSQLHSQGIRLFQCRSDAYSLADTSYVAVTGPQTMWPGAASTKLSDIKDGTFKTIMLVEVHNSGIHWMEPRDLDVSQMAMAVNSPGTICISSGHNGFAHVAFASGEVRAIDVRASPQALHAALTISGGEKDKIPPARRPR